jgi:hypothetical protein
VRAVRSQAVAIKKHASFIWGVMIALAFLIPLAIGLALIVQWVVFTREAHASARWPSTEGRVLSARFEKTQQPDDSIRLEYDAEYEYEVGGVRYRGTGLALEPMRDRELREMSRADIKLSPGEAVRVYYNPEDPSEALLLPGRGPHWISLALGVILLSLPAALVVWVWRARPGAAPADEPTRPSGGRPRRGRRRP